MMIIFFFNDTATTEIYTLSLHDALPISGCVSSVVSAVRAAAHAARATPGLQGPPHERRVGTRPPLAKRRSEEHTSELQSRQYLVCRLLLEKKKTHHKHS